jgi:hypothetical protein
MKNLFTLCLACVFLGTVANSQLQRTLRPGQSSGVLSFTSEDFEGPRFPPAGWSVEFTGIQYWTLRTGVSAYGTGSGAACFEFFAAAPPTIQSLILSGMGTSAAGDSLQFDHAYASYSGENDSLIIRASTDGGMSFTILARLVGGMSGSLVTAPPQGTWFSPTAAQWARKSYALPPGTSRILFTAISGYGNNLYLDNCRIAARPVVDVAALSVDIPNPTLPLPQIPKASVKNNGTAPQTFSVTMSITPGGYTSTKTVTALAGGATSQVAFDGWTPLSGPQKVTAITMLAGDLDRANDTVFAMLTTNAPQTVAAANAFFRDGQVFITWDNLPTSDRIYTVYRSVAPILSGQQLASAQNLGNVPHNSGLNVRVSWLTDSQKYFRIDSASAVLGSNKGLFVATSTTAGAFYYAITSRLNGLEDTLITPGANALTTPVAETVMLPRPVWQATGTTFIRYVLFATKVTSSIFPQMTNVGTFPYNFALVKKGNVSPHPLTFFLHPSGGSFLADPNYFTTTGDPNEWILSLDEWLPGSDGSSFSYGFQEGYDPCGGTNCVPTSGVIYNYTAAKTAYLVNWAIRNLPVDSTRTYMTGYSMGAVGTLLNVMMIPDKIAAVFIWAPVCDLAHCALYLDRLYGSAQTNLWTNEGYRRNERLNASYLLSARREVSLPLLFTFFGKNDETTGWPEKVVFYDSLKTSKHGGFHFWSPTDHMQVKENDRWKTNYPDFSFMTRYRTNLSYPAFSNCAIDDNPGNGNPTDGDSTGSINGHLDWNDNITDAADRWEITLRLKGLSTISGTHSAPDSASVDVTPRRLQVFHVPPGDRIIWENRRNGLVIQQSSFMYTGGLVTLPGVKVYKDSVRLSVTHVSTSVDEERARPLAYALAQNYPNPFNPKTIVSYQLSAVSKTKIAVYDMLGREVAVLFQGTKPAGRYEVVWDAAGFPSGVYICRMNAGDFVATRKMLLVK